MYNNNNNNKNNNNKKMVILSSKEKKYIKIFLISVLGIFLFMITCQIFEVDPNKIGVKESNYHIIDVENIKVATTDKCPKESSFHVKSDFISKTGERFSSCNYQYLCNKNDEKCVIFNSPMELSYYSTSLSHSDNNVYGHAYDNLDDDNKMILIGCSEERLKDRNCSTDICVSNDDCLSNSCVNGICMSNKENPILLCGPVIENSELKVKCLASLEEPCQEDTDCAGHAVCSKKSNVCIIENIPEKVEKTEISYNKIIFIVIAIVTVIAIVILFYSLFKPKKSDNN